jgi:hypothetical protein
MNDSMRDLLRQGADTVVRPQLDVDQLVALADRRIVRRRLTAVTVSAVAVAAIAIGGSALGPDDATPSPAPALPSETPTIEPTPGTPDASPAASVPRVPSEEVRGWPTTSRNRAGAYSWDGDTCAYSKSCIRGFMHNGYGSGDVKITLEPGEGRVPEGWTPTTVAGRQGAYRQVNAFQEVWWVEIHGTALEIRLTTKPGTKHSEIEEGRAIVASMYTEKRPTELGWRLVFILTTNDWDSG